MSTEPDPPVPLPICAAAPVDPSVADAVVEVRGDLGLAGVTLCSGVIVAPRLVLTSMLCLVVPSGLLASDLMAPPPDTPDFGRVIFGGDVDYAGSCRTDAGWDVREDGTLAARFGEPLDPSRLTVVVRRDDVNVETSTVRSVELPNADSRCWDTIAALVLDQPLMGAGLPVRLRETTELGEQVTLAGSGLSSAGPSVLETSIEAIAVDSPSDTTPPRSLTLRDQICSYETGGAVAARATGELIALVAYGTGSYCGDPEGKTIATRVAPFRRLLIGAANAAAEVLQTLAPIAEGSEPLAACAPPRR